MKKIVILSEAKDLSPTEILRFAQDDRPDGSSLVSFFSLYVIILSEHSFL